MKKSLKIPAAILAVLCALAGCKDPSVSFESATSDVSSEITSKEK